MPKEDDSLERQLLNIVHTHVDASTATRDRLICELAALLMRETKKAHEAGRRDERAHIMGALAKIAKENEQRGR